MIHILFLSTQNFMPDHHGTFPFGATSLLLTSLKTSLNASYCSHIYMAASPYCICDIMILDLWCVTINQVHSLPKQSTEEHKFTLY